MVKRTLVIALSVLLAASPVAAGDLTKSISAAAAKEAAQRPASRGENPYMLPGIILMSGGAGLVLLAFLAPSGVSCTDKSTSTNFNVTCGTHANKGLLFGGIGAAAVGGFLIMKGERMRNAPDIIFGPNGVKIQKSIRF